MATTSKIEPLKKPITPKTSQLLGSNDSEQLSVLRSDALDLSGKLQMPSSQDERPWKYLDISQLDVEDYPIVVSDENQKSNISETGNSAGSIELTNGIVIHNESYQKGVGLSTTGTSLLGQAVHPDTNRLTALHYAYLQDIAVIEISADTKIDKPIRVEHRYTTKQFATPHTVIIAGANSNIEIIEQFFSTNVPLIATPIVEIFTGPGATVNYTTVHRWGSKTESFGAQQTITEENSQIKSLSLAISGKTVKQHIGTTLKGRGSASELFGAGYGTGMGKGVEHIDFYTLQDHVGEDTFSDLLFKSALGGTSKSVYYGITRIGENARNSSANQQNRNLLLSPTAQADSDPVLEIHTNDVQRGSHGATVGPVEDDQLFYLQSRGLTLAEATDLLIRGFFLEVLDRVPDEQLRQELEGLVESRDNTVK